ncbi:MAG: DNA repair protein RecO [Cyanobacteria bacterium J083]|nr:MAG: DNA repair protein RecO [Cyanobacteria bacterium J083]
MTQIESINTHSGLSQDLAKLSAAQYLAELSLCLATVEQEEKELYQLCKKLFCSLEQIAKGDYFTVIVNLAYGVFHHLQIAGIVPQLDNCCLSQKPVFINSQLGGWQVGFSFEAGGIVNLSDRKPSSEFAEESVSALIEQQESCKIDYRLNSLELKLLKHLKENNLSDLSQPLPLQFRTLLESAWLKIERLLREYTRYHLGCKLRSAELLDTLDPVQF